MVSNREAGSAEFRPLPRQHQVSAALNHLALAWPNLGFPWVKTVASK